MLTGPFFLCSIFSKPINQIQQIQVFNRLSRGGQESDKKWKIFGFLKIVRKPSKFLVIICTCYLFYDSDRRFEVTEKG
jgi:hypothetical protein